MLRRINISLWAIAAVLTVTSIAEARPRRYDRQETRQHRVDREVYADVGVLPGDLVTARLGGSWTDAEVRSTYRGLALLHYVGYSSAWDRWVDVDEVRPRIVAARDLEVMPRVEILWGGNWYDGVIRERRGELVRVHYVGWSDSWDEWLGPDRVRYDSPVPMRRHDQRRSSSHRNRRVSYRY